MPIQRVYGSPNTSGLNMFLGVTSGVKIRIERMITPARQVFQNNFIYLFFYFNDRMAYLSRQDGMPMAPPIPVEKL
jgi:hypothetical protein